MDVLVVLGLAYAVLGAFLAWRPMTAARAINHLRFAPFSARHEAQYRYTGMAIALVGLLLAAAGLVAG